MKYFVEIVTTKQSFKSCYLENPKICDKNWMVLETANKCIHIEVNNCIEVKTSTCKGLDKKSRD